MMFKDRLAAAFSIIESEYAGLEDVDEFGESNSCSVCGWEDDENRTALAWCVYCVDTGGANKICLKCDPDIESWGGRADGNRPRITKTGWYTNGRGVELCPEHVQHKDKYIK